MSNIFVNFIHHKSAITNLSVETADFVIFE